jgi:hypothetical protein
MHNCPNCGKLTDGAWSDSGIQWAICDECTRNARSDVDGKQLVGRINQGTGERYRLNIAVRIAAKFWQCTIIRRIRRSRTASAA